MSSFNKLIVFDCDGTLVDSQHMIVRAMQDTFSAAGIAPVTATDVRSIVGLSLEDAIGALTPGLSRHDHMDLAEDYKKIYYRLRVELAAGPDPLYEGCLDTLQQLSAAGYLLGVATGNSRRGLDRTLAEHNIADMFVTLQTADGHPSKPHPSMVQTAVAEAGSSPDVTIVIGDTSYDMEMSVRAGCRRIGVEWGYHSTDELNKAGAEHVAQSYDEIPDLVKKWLG